MRIPVFALLLACGENRAPNDSCGPPECEARGCTPTDDCGCACPAHVFECLRVSDGASVRACIADYEEVDDWLFADEVEECHPTDATCDPVEDGAFLAEDGGESESESEAESEPEPAESESESESESGCVADGDPCDYCWQPDECDPAYDGDEEGCDCGCDFEDSDCPTD